jgi:PAS domain S-box-containing protein
MLPEKSTFSRPINVLHVDDDEAFLIMAKQCLEMQNGIRVKSVLSVNEALAILKNKKFDAIISDYEMKDKDGLEFLSALKAIGNTTPFVLFTGKARDEIAVKALNSGAFRYLDKRGSPAATYAELASCIEQASQYVRAQQMLIENEKRFRAIFDSSLDAIVVFNDGGDIIYSNKSAKFLLDYSKDEITKALNKHFNKQFLASYEQNMHEGFKELPNGNLSMMGNTVELTIKNGLAKKIIVELSFSAFIENGQWFGVSIIRDVTERKNQEHLFEKSSQMLKALFSYNPEAIVFLDKSFRVTEINSSFTKIFGFNFEDIKNRNIDIILPEGLEPESKKMKKAIIKKQISLNTKRKRSNGSLVDVCLSAGPLVVSGKLYGFFVTFLDVSDLVFVQGILESALERSILLNEKIKVLGAFTRHDVRNKLALIQGNLYLIKNSCKIEPRSEKHFETIDRSIKNICDIFDFAKTYEMIGIEELVQIDVGKIIQNALCLFSDLKGVKIENCCTGFEVIADSLLTQVFYNLVDNSLKYGEKTQNISIYVEKLENGSAKLTYKDDGVGIDNKFRKHLFEKGNGKGTGLGLYLIHSICQVYGWTLEERGQIGKGVKFEFTIPAEKVKSFIPKTTPSVETNVFQANIA